ncbi:phosphatase PAP2 family protein [Salinibacterium sp. CAN_S4]|uniref:phosphatase PAP2 family protein n=1 Tax=Salinibacterium sp. CAN_S4 TaxID=2787727 RepID=UPI0018EF7BB9
MSNTRLPSAFVGAVGLAIVIVAGVLIATTGRDLPFGLDQPWHDLLLAHHAPVADTVARFLNVAGGTLSMTIVTVVLAVGLAIKRHFTEAASVALTVALASGMSSLLKTAVARPRPTDGIVAAGSTSFPSGHTTTAAAITIALAIAFPFVWSRVLAAVWIPVMAVSRNYLLVHWLSDVLAGALLGASVALVVTAALRGVRARFLKEPSPDRAPIAG